MSCNNGSQIYIYIENLGSRDLEMDKSTASDESWGHNQRDRSPAGYIYDHDLVGMGRVPGLGRNDQKPKVTRGRL